jgi:Uma2 family endonuclease
LKSFIINYSLGASPEQIHQEIIGDLCPLLKVFVKTHQLGKVIISPFDVVLNENNVVVPDMIFMSVAKAAILDGKKAQGSPDLLVVVEVWSPGNKKKERDTKAV